jgi:hypothetical protein
MATIKLKDESEKSFSIDGISYTKGDYRLQYNAKKQILIIPKAVANLSNLSGLPFKTPMAWTYFVDLNDEPYASFEEFSLAISDAINFNSGEATPQYKVYSALISQSGTNAPTLVVLQNTLEQTVTPNAYSSPGRYSLSVSGNILLNNKTWYTITNDNNNRTIAYIDKSNSLGNTSIVTIDTFSFISSAYGDGILQSTPLEIRVYN